MILDQTAASAILERQSFLQIDFLRLDFFRTILVLQDYFCSVIFLFAAG